MYFIVLQSHGVQWMLSLLLTMNFNLQEIILRKRDPLQNSERMQNTETFLRGNSKNCQILEILFVMFHQYLISDHYFLGQSRS